MTAWNSEEERQKQERNEVQGEEERKGRETVGEGGTFPQNRRDAGTLMSAGNYGGVIRSPTEGMLSHSKGLRVTAGR